MRYEHRELAFPPLSKINIDIIVRPVHAYDSAFDNLEAVDEVVGFRRRDNPVVGLRPDAQIRRTRYAFGGKHLRNHIRRIVPESRDYPARKLGQASGYGDRACRWFPQCE